MRVFENKELKRIFWRKRHVVTVQWGNLHNEDFNDM